MARSVIETRECRRCYRRQHCQCEIHPNTTSILYTVHTVRGERVDPRSFEHRVKTIKTMKMNVNRFDDKRVVDDGRIRTRDHGHYKLRVCDDIIYCILKTYVNNKKNIHCHIIVLCLFKCIM